ncbi:MAG: deoxyribodipyrimidine photo-lyase [Myxococcaceae bacterium]|jgi:deoxyribodipyrimidine photo-lyase|nr:deoxyribodipyrimidine photo-lyase [Myxococcaceae bacterium]MCA3014184.1 deoxyribodipyrimidine photo-lyase [Myxococcaceae bacterium]
MAALQLVWFKRDLRVVDHPALAAAARAGPVLGLYVFEPSLVRAPETDASHVTLVRQSLVELREALAARGTALLVRVGEAVDVLGALHAALRFEALWSHQETGLLQTYARDRAVKQWAREEGVRWTELAQSGVRRPHGGRDGWAAHWEAFMRAPLAQLPQRLGSPDVQVDPGPLPTAEALGARDSGKRELQAGGARAGQATLDDFLERRSRGYLEGLSSPTTAWASSSRLSVHLAAGTLSARFVFQRALRVRERADEDHRRSLDAFLSRLRWRCHFTQKLEDEPELERRNQWRGADGLRLEDEAAWPSTVRSRFDRFTHGQTGFPLVDAVVRCLRATGWVNFRMRALVASFAAYDAWLHWRPTARFFAPHFLDFEPGIHFPQFQMQSGTTGINALRIYSPDKQLLEQDPDGDFVRRWVPELARVPLAWLPWPATMPAAVQAEAGCRVGADYPPPLVDHLAATREARRRLEQARRREGGPEARAAVFEKHGSRRPARPRR